MLTDSQYLRNILGLRGYRTGPLIFDFVSIVNENHATNNFEFSLKTVIYSKSDMNRRGIALNCKSIVRAPCHHVTGDVYRFLAFRKLKTETLGLVRSLIPNSVHEAIPNPNPNDKI